MSGPYEPDTEVMAFAADLGRHVAGQINEFSKARGINADETPLQETLIALGTLISNAICQQPETERAVWLQYVISGITTNTGVHFMVALLPPDVVAKLEGSPGKDKLNS